MKTHYQIMTLMAVLLSPIYAYSQDSIASHREEEMERRLNKATKIIFIDSKNAENPSRDSIESLMNIFYTNQYRHFQDPTAPSLMFMSKEADFAMGISGVIRMRGWYGWNGNIPANGFCPYLIPMTPDPTQKRKLDATPAGTAFVFTMFGNSRVFGKYLGMIEMKFNGYNNKDMKLGKAYVTAGDWTVGYAPSTFTDPSSVPPTIDGAGPNGKSEKTNVLVRYFHTFKSNWSIAGGIEIPKSNIEVADASKIAKCSDYVPDIAALVQYKWKRSHVRVSALGRMMSYRSIIEMKNFNVAGWALQGSAKIALGHDWILYGQVNYGKGHSSYMNGMSINEYDLAGDPENPNRMYAPANIGFSFGAQYYFKPNLFGSLDFGEDRTYRKGNPNDDSYKRGLYGAVNVFWDITPRFRVGAEYLWGQRQNYDGRHKAADRVDALFQLQF